MAIGNHGNAGRLCQRLDLPVDPNCYGKRAVTRLDVREWRIDAAVERQRLANCVEKVGRRVPTANLRAICNDNIVQSQRYSRYEAGPKHRLDAEERLFQHNRPGADWPLSGRHPGKRTSAKPATSAETSITRGGLRKSAGPQTIRASASGPLRTIDIQHEAAFHRSRPSRRDGLSPTRADAA